MGKLLFGTVITHGEPLLLSPNPPGCPRPIWAPIHFFHTSILSAGWVLPTGGIYCCFLLIKHTSNPSHSWAPDIIMPHQSFMCSLNTTYVHTPFHTPFPRPCPPTHSPHIWLHVGYTLEKPAGTLIYTYQSMTHRPYSSVHSVSNLHCSPELSLTTETLKPRGVASKCCNCTEFMPQLCFAFLCLLPQDEVNSWICKT